CLYLHWFIVAIATGIITSYIKSIQIGRVDGTSQISYNMSPTSLYRCIICIQHIQGIDIGIDIVAQASGQAQKQSIIYIYIIAAKGFNAGSGKFQIIIIGAYI